MVSSFGYRPYPKFCQMWLHSVTVFCISSMFHMRISERRFPVYRLFALVSLGIRNSMLNLSGLFDTYIVACSYFWQNRQSWTFDGTVVSVQLVAVVCRMVKQFWDGFKEISLQFGRFYHIDFDVIEKTSSEPSQWWPNCSLVEHFLPKKWREVGSHEYMISNSSEKICTVLIFEAIDRIGWNFVNPFENTGKIAEYQGYIEQTKTHWLLFVGRDSHLDSFVVLYHLVPEFVFLQNSSPVLPSSFQPLKTNSQISQNISTFTN